MKKKKSGRFLHPHYTSSMAKSPAAAIAFWQLALMGFKISEQHLHLIGCSHYFGQHISARHCQFFFTSIWFYWRKYIFFKKLTQNKNRSKSQIWQSNFFYNHCYPNSRSSIFFFFIRRMLRRKRPTGTPTKQIRFLRKFVQWLGFSSFIQNHHEILVNYQTHFYFYIRMFIPFAHNTTHSLILQRSAYNKRMHVRSF